MRRTRLKQLPDLVSRAHLKNFTAIPNEFLRNENLSLKAKGLLCIMLSNSDGWTSYAQALQQLSKDGRESTNSALKELEQNGYLMRIKCKDAEKKWTSSVWVYTDVANNFVDMDELLFEIEKRGLTAVVPQTGFPQTGIRNTGSRKRESVTRKPATKNNNIRIKRKNKKEEVDGVRVRVRISDFDKFWELYPNKVDKGKALTKWESICTSSSWDRHRPTMRTIENAIKAQIETVRWKKGFIPMPSTWLNQKRWLDDPAEMNKTWGDENKPSNLYNNPEKSEYGW